MYLLEWNMVTYRKNREVKFGWIPNSYLILKEENDEIVEDIQSYLLGKSSHRNDNSKH